LAQFSSHWNSAVHRERKTLTVERVQHVNRIKGLLFSQGVSGYEPLRRNRRQRLDELKTGDGRPLPPHLKGQIGRELDRLELLLGQIKAVEAERDALLTPATETEGMPRPQAMLIDLRGSRVRPVIPTKAQPAAWFPGTPNMALKGGGILPGLWSRWHSHRWGSGRRRQTKTPVADFFKDGDRTNFLRVHRTRRARNRVGLSLLSLYGRDAVAMKNRALITFGCHYMKEGNHAAYRY
jgi:hypothetical protein